MFWSTNTPFLLSPCLSLLSVCGHFCKCAAVLSLGWSAFKIKHLFQLSVLFLKCTSFFHLGYRHFPPSFDGFIVSACLQGVHNPLVNFCFCLPKKEVTLQAVVTPAVLAKLHHCSANQKNEPVMQTHFNHTSAGIASLFLFLCIGVLIRH